VVLVVSILFLLSNPFSAVLHLAEWHIFVCHLLYKNMNVRMYRKQFSRLFCAHVKRESVLKEETSNYKFLKTKSAPESFGPMNKYEI